MITMQQANDEMQTWKTACKQVSSLQIGQSMTFKGATVERRYDGYFVCLGQSSEIFDNPFAVHGVLGML